MRNNNYFPDGRPQKVICETNGKVFDSITAASKWAKVHTGSLISALSRGKGKAVFGNYSWRKIPKEQIKPRRD